MSDYKIKVSLVDATGKEIDYIRRDIPVLAESIKKECILTDWSTLNLPLTITQKGIMIDMSLIVTRNLNLFL